MADELKLSLPTPDPANLNYGFEHIRRNLGSVKNVTNDNSDSKLESACVEMESLFINYLLKEMRATVNKSGFISGGRAEEIFTSLRDVELSKRISEQGGIGLSSILLDQLSEPTEKEEDPGSHE